MAIAAATAPRDERGAGPADRGCRVTPLRAALDEAYDRAGTSHAAYTDPGTSLAGALIQAVHVTEVRAFARTLDSYQPSATLATRYHHTDVLESVRAVTDASGAVLSRHEYLPFGEDSVAAGGDLLRFTGKELDPETGLQYFRARYYNAANARFTAVDPYLDLDGAMFNPQQWNRYGYVLNDPVGLVDPDGLDPCPDGVHQNCFYGGTDEQYVDPGDLRFLLESERRRQDNSPLIVELARGIDRGASPILPVIEGAMNLASLFNPLGGVLNCLTYGCGSSRWVLAAVTLPGSRVASKAVSLPAWKGVGVDMIHVAERHMAGGALARGRDAFPPGMTERAVENAIRQAYRFGEKLRLRANA
jgi:RHS repeat-associated protein